MASSFILLPLARPLPAHDIASSAPIECLAGEAVRPVTPCHIRANLQIYSIAFSRCPKKPRRLAALCQNPDAAATEVQRSITWGQQDKLPEHRPGRVVGVGVFADI